MSTMLQVEEGFAYNDVKTIILKEADMEQKAVRQFLDTPKFDVPGSDGLQWWIRLYPNGEEKFGINNVSLCLRVNKSVKSKFMFMVPGSNIKEQSDTYKCIDAEVGWGWWIACHHEIRAFLKDGKLTIKCFVEFDVPQRRDHPIPRMFQLFRHVPTDVEFVVGSDRVPAHRNFLSLISPVFHAMFSHNNVESKLNKVEIVDFDCTTVKSVVDYCYGHGLQDLSVETVVNILRFCDKYFITAAIEELEKLPLMIPSVENFCQVIRYAYDCNRDGLLADCNWFFEGHQDEINELAEFADLPPLLVVDILKRAFDLKTDFDVLYHADENDIGFVVDHLEEPLIKSVSIDDFCPAVQYAWKCSRDNLKQVCAAFLNDNRDEVVYLEDFTNLPAETIREVLKAARALKLGSV